MDDVRQTPVEAKYPTDKQPRHEASPLSLTPTIFHEPWWMEIATQGSWSEARVSTGGNLVGRLPYQISKRALGVKSLDMPALVHVLGPALAIQPGKSPSLVTRELTIITDLLAQLPRASHVSFRLHGGISNTLAFSASGFTSFSGYTVMIRPDTTDNLWRQMRDKTRNVIRRAQECLQVTSMSEANSFLDFYSENLLNRKQDNLYDQPYASELIAECLRRNKGRILVAADHSGRMQAAILTVWDRTTEFYFMSTRRLDSVNGAVCLLIWEALQRASSQGRSFDMDGIHVVNHKLPNLLLLTGFGGLMEPRYVVTRSSPAVQLAASVRRYLSLNRRGRQPS